MHGLSRASYVRLAAWLSLLTILSAGSGCRSINRPFTLLPTSLDHTVIVKASLGAPVAMDSASTILPCSIPRSADEQASRSNLIDLGAALRLAGVDNPTIRLAEEQVREALAGQLAARAMLIPNVNIGGNYNAHTGPLLDDPGFLRFPTRQSLYLGAGAGTVGASNMPVPGVWLFAHLGDAIYAPLAAQQRVTGRQSEGQAVRNATLLDVATAYLDLAGADAQAEILQRAEAEVMEIARTTDVFAKAGQGNPSDANRAVANAELIRRQLREAEGGVTAASARLCRLLSLDPTMHLRPPRGAIEPVRLVAEDTDIETLVAAAIRSRPELLACSAAIEEAQIRVRQERVRPWLPLVGIGYSNGVFGGGSNQTATNFSPLEARADITLVAVWNGQNLGGGNRARARMASAVVGQSLASYDLMLNQIRREVTEALAACKTGARQIDAARAALIVAEEGFRLEIDRTKQGQGLPIETLDSFRQLLDARQDLIRAVIAFNMAQLRLFVSLGNDPTSGKVLE